MDRMISVSKCSIGIGIDIEKIVTICSPTFSVGGGHFAMRCGGDSLILSDQHLFGSLKLDNMFSRGGIIYLHYGGWGALNWGTFIVCCRIPI